MARDQQPAMQSTSSAGQRLDKWLWYARVAKTRTLASSLVTQGRIRLDRVKVTKPSQLVRPGDVITSSAQRQVRVLKIVALGKRRGPPVEARGLFEELTPEPVAAISLQRIAGRDSPSIAVREPGSGRPTKRDRRALDRLKDRP